MTNPKDGGPAYPVSIQVQAESYTGMSLRDYFAGQALAGQLAFPGAVMGGTSKTPAVCAKVAYDYADAMIAERDKT